MIAAAEPMQELRVLRRPTLVESGLRVPRNRIMIGEVG